MEHSLCLLALYRANRQERAKEEVEMARLRGTPIRGLTISRRSKWGTRSDEDPDSETGTKSQGSRLRQRPPRRASALQTMSDYGEKSSDDEEKGNEDVTHSKSRWRRFLEYRDRSTSAWLHFPHVELLFLLFAFEGAVAAGVSALRESRCTWVIATASTALVSRLYLSKTVCRAQVTS